MMIKKISYLIFTLVLTFSFFGIKHSFAAAYDYDLSIAQADLRFSKDVFIVGDKIRIYARVNNAGNHDITGYVSFFRGSSLIGNSKSVSVLPGSTGDTFVDFTIPEDSFNIQAKIQGTDPADQNSTNDTTQSKLIVPDVDTDGDGTVDRLDEDDDNDSLTDVQEQVLGTNPLKRDTDGDGYDDKNDFAPLNNQEWQDTDGDGIGNNADPDDDNDGWSDSQEQAYGTDPLKADTDGDGISDPQDKYPLDSSRSKEEASRNIFQPIDATKIQATQNIDVANINNISDLQNQLNNLTNTDETAEKIKEDPSLKLDDLVEKVSIKQTAFLRVSNPIIWLILAILIVLITIIFIFFRKRFNNNGAATEESQEIFSNKAASPAPFKNHLPSSHPQVINLKELIKKK